MGIGTIPTPGDFPQGESARPELLILGASTRAAAQSGRRAGLVVACADRFADQDLEAIAEVVKVQSQRFPARLSKLLERFPGVPWMYTGPLENHPTLVGRWAGRSPLLGNRPDVLRKVRNPIAWSTMLTEHGIAAPRCSRTPVKKRGWIRKRSRGEYWQEWIVGESRSAMYLANDSGVELIGVTNQLVGERWLNAPPLVYCGSVRLETSESERSAWLQLGTCLAKWSGLRGLFGVDAIVKGGLPWPVEINPRYTASVELLERVLGRALIADHFAAFARHGGGVKSVREVAEPCQEVGAKAVLFAPGRVSIPAGFWPWLLDNGFLAADIPHDGEIINRGQPILTAFGADEASLKKIARTIYSRLAIID